MCICAPGTRHTGAAAQQSWGRERGAKNQGKHHFLGAPSDRQGYTRSRRVGLLPGNQGAGKTPASASTERQEKRAKSMKASRRRRKGGAFHVRENTNRKCSLRMALKVGFHSSLILRLGRRSHARCRRPRLGENCRASPQRRKFWWDRPKTEHQGPGSPPDLGSVRIMAARSISHRNTARGQLKSMRDIFS